MDSLEKKQVFLLRWWEAKENYKNYDDFVKKYEINPYEEKKIKWSDNLQDVLWTKFKVIDIERFNKWFADYNIWKKVFEKYLDFIKEGDILIGYSLWWSFFLKYFSWLEIDKRKEILWKISKLILVAPAIEDSENELLWTFKFNYKNDLKKLDEFWNKIFIFASRDDFVVPFEEAEIIKKYLPNANYVFFEDKGHFLIKEFPELVNLIIK